jgi:hypothetical protein
MVRKKGFKSRKRRLSWSQKVTESSEVGDNVCIKLGRFIFLDERDDIVEKSDMSSKQLQDCVPSFSGDLAQIIEGKHSENS